MKLINYTIDKNLYSVELLSEFFKKYEEDKEDESFYKTLIDFEKSVVRNVIEKTIKKYTNDYSSDTYYKLVDYLNNDRDYFNDHLESEVYNEIIDELKTNPNYSDEGIKLLDDFYIGEGFINTLLHYFRMFYEKWYLENKINEKLGELVSEVELV
jgi:hypothetical protein